MKENIKINNFHFRDGKSVDYTPTEYTLMEAVRVSLGEESLDSSLDIRNFYDKGVFADSTLKDLYGKILGYIVNSNKPFNQIIEEVSNATSAILFGLDLVYNEIGYESLEYMFALSLNDMIEIVKDRRLLDSIQQLAKNPIQNEVANVYNTLDVVMHDPIYSENKIAMAYCTGIVNKMQMKQCFGTRGFVINLDGTINDKPVVSNYLFGLYDNYEYTLDSKSASIALYYSQSAIKRSETFANGLQTAGMVVEKVIYTDCGNQDTMEYEVNGPGLNIHGEHHNGDLKSLRGILYKLNRDDKEWLIFNGDEEHLYGKKVYIRLPFHCKLDNRHHICINCLGRLAFHAHPEFNIGMYLLSRLSDLINQLVLSAKHLIASAIADSIILSKEAEEFFIIDGRHIKLRPDKVGKELVMKIYLKEFRGYQELEGRDIREINTHKLSAIENIGFSIDDKEYQFKLLDYGRNGILTKDFLQYIVNNTIKVDEKFILYINMKRWKKSWKIMEVPESMFDVRAYGASIRSFMSDANGRGIHKMSREEFLLELYNLTSRRFNVSFSILGLIAYILGVKDPKNGDFRIARDEPYTLTSINKLLNKGSITGAFTTGSLGPLFNMDTWSSDKRMDHPLDLYLAPEEVMNAIKDGYYD